jgi:HD-GYP domain-containing protein (c-di-GMP phosphodiesterase class II)
LPSRLYPDGLEGEEIPLAARIVAAADAYDVMVRGRPYRPKRLPAEALQELWREAGRQFDVRVVEALVGRLLGEAKGHVSHQVGAPPIATGSNTALHPLPILLAR